MYLKSKKIVQVTIKILAVASFMFVLVFNLSVISTPRVAETIGAEQIELVGLAAQVAHGEGWCEGGSTWRCYPVAIYASGQCAYYQGSSCMWCDCYA